MGKISIANLKKTAYYFRRNGLKHTLDAVRERLDSSVQPRYHYEPIAQQELAGQTERAEREGYTVSFSIIVPAYRTPESYLREMIGSVCGQSYGNWELIIADATEGEEVCRVVEEISEQEKRIRYIRLKENINISENTNAGIRQAQNEYIGLLDHDDILERNALYEIASVIESAKRDGKQLQMLYSDEDKCDGEGRVYYEPNFKENFNLDLLLTNNYICHFMVMETEMMKELLLRGEYNGAQDFDLALRAADRLFDRDDCIAHVPKVLYHWRCHTLSTAENPRSKLYAYDAGRRAVQDFLDRRSWRASVCDTPHLGFYAVKYEESPLKIRRDLGAVGGRLVHKGKIVSGRISETGDIFYRGLSVNYTGYLHRAVLAQDAEALDIRNLEVAPSCRESFEQITGVKYVALPGTEIFDASALPGDTDYIALSVRVCRELRRQGFRLLYLPERSMEINKITTGTANRPGDPAENRADSQIERRTDTSTEKVTVVIPNYNGIKFIEECLTTLFRQDPDTPEYRVIVVDNGSVDGSRELVEEQFPKVSVIALSENTGFSYAVNRGILAANAPYVILLNNDTKVAPRFVKALYDAIEERENAFSVSAKMLMWDRPELLDDAGDRYCVLGWGYARGKGKPAAEYEKSCRVFSACGGAAIYRRRVFEEIGYFDENHFAYMEDLDIGYRAAIHGYQNFYEPKAEVIHYGSASSGSRYNRWKTELAAANNVYCIAKNMPILQLIWNLPFLIVGFLLKYLFFVRKRMGICYLKGLAKGLKRSFSAEGKAHKIRFRRQNLKNYFSIQWQFYTNTLRILKKY